MRREHLIYYAIALAALIGVLAWVGVPPNTILVGLLVLACPLMMLFMMRGGHGDGHGSDRGERPRDTSGHSGH